MTAAPILLRVVYYSELLLLSVSSHKNLASFFLLLLPTFQQNETKKNAKPMYMDNLGIVETNVASPGFGAAANSFMDFVNADEMYATYSIPQGLHRRSDPGAGAFTYYHSRYTKAKSKKNYLSTVKGKQPATSDNDDSNHVAIHPGQELFVSYGDKWFLGRKKILGPIPVRGDHARADRLYRKFRQNILGNHSGGHQPTDNNNNNKSRRPRRTSGGGDSAPAATTTKTDDEQPPPNAPQPTNSKPLLSEQVATELWDTFVLNSPWTDSPTMAALPPKEDYEAMYEQTLIGFKKSKMHRSPEWLAENGVCADHMYFGESTIRQAGHGAFAARHLPEGAIILPIPLIHIPDRKVLNMYELHAPPGGPVTGDKERPRPPQLLLNYCLGHRDSTMLLSPYGPVFHLINHNQTLANVKLQWAAPERSQHKPEMLMKNATEFESYSSAQLAMELVAIKDIEPGEEIFLDYGDEWEAAWQKHEEEWKPVEGADTYVSAFEMNQQFDHVYRTEFEKMKGNYPSNLMLKFHKSFQDDKVRRNWLTKHPETITDDTWNDDWLEHGSVDCEILRYEQVEGRTLYTLVIPADDERKEWTLLEDVPREAIFFQDRPYTSDIFLENAFRHDIRIPDYLFPEEWKNLKLR